jgi:hypothetical protein
VIDVSAFTGITDFSDLVTNHASETGGNTTIAFDGDDSVVLVGVTIAELHADDFIFS